MEDLDSLIARLKDAVSDFFDTTDVEVSKKFVTLKGKFRVYPEDIMPTLKERLNKENCIPFLSKEKDEDILRIAFFPPQKAKKSSPTVNIVLLLLTILTTVFAGAMNAGVNPFSRDIVLGIPFSFAILTILGSHELGHYFFSKKNGVDATLPYFIPFPHILGTFGAVIKQRSPIPDRKSLLEIGASGPLIGLLLAIPFCIIGLSLSEIKSVEIIKGQPVLTFGNSLLLAFLTKLTLPTLPPNYEIFLHPIGIAGWAGILVTGMNLLPFGQLDGGHICYALFGRYHRRIARIAFLILIPLGFLWVGWFLWAGLMLIFGFHHPPPLDDITPLDRKRKAIGIASLIAFIVTFTPVPLKYGVLT